MKTLVLITLSFILVVVLGSMTSRVKQDDKWPVPDKYVKMKNPYANTKDAEQIGKRLYAINCRSCHGSKGKGDGTKAAELKTKVPDLTSPEFKAQTDGSIYYKTIFGKEDMPAFEKKINSEEDRWMLVNYLKSLQ